MFYSTKIKDLFSDKAMFERQYKKFWRQESSFEQAMADPDRVSGYWEIMAFFEKKIAQAIRDEEISKVIV